MAKTTITKCYTRYAVYSLSGIMGTKQCALTQVEFTGSYDDKFDSIEEATNAMIKKYENKYNDYIYIGNEYVILPTVCFETSFE